jgi:hypothetical protein
LESSIRWKGERLGVVEMRRHYANYFRGFPNFKQRRLDMVTQDDPQIIYALLDAVVVDFAGFTPE